MDDNGPPVPPGVDPHTPTPARIWNYALGGKDHFQADRKAAEAVLAAMPSLLVTAQLTRQFQADAVRRLLARGVRQFLDIGTGLPVAGAVHEVAQREAPESRVVYVDNDPMVLAHARALLTSTPEGRCAYIQADLREPAKILAAASQTLDLTRPTAVLLVAVLHFLTDADDPRGIVRQLMDGIRGPAYLVTWNRRAPTGRAPRRRNAPEPPPGETSVRCPPAGPGGDTARIRAGYSDGRPQRRRCAGEGRWPWITAAAAVLAALGALTALAVNHDASQPKLEAILRPPAGLYVTRFAVWNLGTRRPVTPPAALVRLGRAAAQPSSANAPLLTFSVGGRLVAAAGGKAVTVYTEVTVTFRNRFPDLGSGGSTWVDDVSGHVGDAVNMAFDIAADPGAAAETVTADVSKVVIEDSLTALLGKIPDYGSNGSFFRNGQIVTQASQQLKAYNAWLASPAVLNMMEDGGQGTSYDNGYQQWVTAGYLGS